MPPSYLADSDRPGPGRAPAVVTAPPGHCVPTGSSGSRRRRNASHTLRSAAGSSIWISQPTIHENACWSSREGGRHTVLKAGAPVSDHQRQNRAYNADMRLPLFEVSLDVDGGTTAAHRETVVVTGRAALAGNGQKSLIDQMAFQEQWPADVPTSVICCHLPPSKASSSGIHDLNRTRLESLPLKAVTYDSDLSRKIKSYVTTLLG